MLCFPGVAAILTSSIDRIDRHMRFAKPLNLAAARCARPLSTAIKFDTSILGNGVQVATVDSPGTLYATGLLVRTDRALPQSASQLAASLLAIEKTAGARLQEAVDGDAAISGSTMVKAKREHVMFTAVGQNEHLARLTELVAATCTRSILDGDAMLKEMPAIVQYEQQEAENKPLDFLPELMHEAAFTGSPSLGTSLHSIGEHIGELHKGVVGDVWHHIWQPANLIVVAAGAGLEHPRFAELVERLYGHLQPTAAAFAGNYVAKFTPSQLLVDRPDLPLVHVGIALRALPAAHRDAFAMAILQMLLGGGGSFSSGGPGKGMYSRLYTQVLNRYSWIESAKQMHAAYGQAGFIGIQASSTPDRARDIVRVIARQLRHAASSLTPAELARAKNQVKSAVLGALESRPTQLDDLAEQMHYLGPLGLLTPADICARVDAVQAETLEAVTQQMYEQGRGEPAVVAFGPTQRLPPYDQIVAELAQ